MPFRRRRRRRRRPAPPPTTAGRRIASARRGEPVRTVENPFFGRPFAAAAAHTFSEREREISNTALSVTAGHVGVGSNGRFCRYRVPCKCVDWTQRSRTIIVINIYVYACTLNAPGPRGLYSGAVVSDPVKRPLWRFSRELSRHLQSRTALSRSVGDESTHPRGVGGGECRGQDGFCKSRAERTKRRIFTRDLGATSSEFWIVSRSRTFGKTYGGGQRLRCTPEESTSADVPAGPGTALARRTR